MLGNIVLNLIKARIFISFSVLFCFTLPLICQEVKNISIQHTIYDTEDGLPNQITSCIFQDSKGFFWIATNYGFSRFDGKSFVNYSPDDLGVSFGTITDIHEDIEGNLWLSEMSHESSLTKKRILIFNPYEETIKPYLNSESQIYYSIASTLEKTILLGTEQGELLECDGSGQKKIYSFEDKRPITQIIATSNNYWLNSGKKLSLIKRNGEFVREWSTSHQFILVGEKGENLYVKDVFLSSENNLEDRILLFKTDNISPEIAAVNKLNDSSETVEKWKYFSAEEKFVVYNHLAGLSLLEETGEDSYLINPVEGDGMSFDVEAVYFCRNGILWVASISGAYKIQITPSKFESFLDKEEPLNFSMRSIVSMGDSLLYSNTYSGNTIYDLKNKKIVQRYPKNDTDIGDGLSSLIANDGCIYVGGTGIAIQQICNNGKDSKFFYYENKLRATSTPGDFWAIFEDSRNKIWLGTNQGLSFLDRKNGVLKPFEKYNQFTELSETIVYDILETETAYWIASKAGLYKMEHDKGITLRFNSTEPILASKFLPTDEIYDIHEDEDGYLWLTTYGSGLIQFNPQDFTHRQLTVKEGLPHNVTNEILEDDFDNLWISTNRGLVRLNRKSGDFINFDKSDGLHIDEFNKKSAAKLNDGRFIFGGLNGCVVFHPKDFLEKEKEAVRSNLRIVQAIIGDSIKNAIDLSQPIVLDDSKVKVTFNLHLLEFSNEEEPSYEWKWKGDNDFSALTLFQLHLFEVPHGESTIIFRAKSAKGAPALNELEVNFSTPFLFSAMQIIIGIGGLLSLYYFLIFRKKEDKSKTIISSKKELSKVEEAVAEVVETELKTAKEPPPKPEKLAIILSPTDKRWLDHLTKSIQESAKIGQFSVEDMANEMNLSSRQLNRKVKQLTGITPNQFLRDIKLEKAKGLLESGTVFTVAEVSFAVGFEKPDYFSRLFQEKYGKRPVTYFDKNKR